MSFQSIGVRCVFHLLSFHSALIAARAANIRISADFVHNRNNNSPSPLSLERSFQEKPNIVPGFVFFSLQSHHIVNTMTHHTIFIPKGYILETVGLVFSPSRATTFLFSAEKSFRLRGECYLSPRRRFLVTAEKRVFVDSEQGKAKEPLQ